VHSIEQDISGVIDNAIHAHHYPVKKKAVKQLVWARGLGFDTSGR
jgi:hypothetical protein